MLESSDESSEDDPQKVAINRGNRDRQKMLDNLCESSGSGDSGSDGDKKKYIEEEKDYSAENFYKTYATREDQKANVMRLKA